MKTDNSNTNTPGLRALLKEWKQEASLPPRFQEQVWRRIERAEAAPVPSVSLATVFANWLTNLLPRPALATAYVAVLLAIGASVGWSQARQETARVAGELSARYAQAVDPYQTTLQP
ncbi:MAG: hypothetical protein KF791_09845 [Verrucomicrobiae bacterium]|nr:hypothetical protein [Verrucomicrobiae bacterium]